MLVARNCQQRAEHGSMVVFETFRRRCTLTKYLLLATMATAAATALYLIEVSTLPCSDCHSRSNANSFDCHLSFQVYGISIGQSMFACCMAAWYIYNMVIIMTLLLVFTNWCIAINLKAEEKKSLSNEVCFRYTFGPFRFSQTPILVHKMHISHSITHRRQARPTRTFARSAIHCDTRTRQASISSPTRPSPTGHQPNQIFLIMILLRSMLRGAAKASWSSCVIYSQMYCWTIWTG